MFSFTTVRRRKGMSAMIALVALAIGFVLPAQTAEADSKIVTKAEAKVEPKSVVKVEVKTENKIEDKKQEEKVKLPGAPVIRDVVATGKTTASITYTKPSEAGDSDVFKYEVTSYPDEVKAVHLGEGTPTFKLNGLRPDTEYYFVVCGTNKQGTTCSTKSKTVRTLPLAPAFTLSNAVETITYGSIIAGALVINTGGKGVFTISPALPAGLNFDSSNGAISGAPTAVQGATTYTVTETNISGSASATYTLTVLKKQLTIVANNSGKTYGDSDPTLTFNVAGLVNGDVTSGDVVRVAGENFGTYAIERGTVDASANYVIDFTPGVFTISAKHISVKANNAGKTYGDSDPDFAYSADSLVAGDSFTGSLVRDGGANVGEYSINQGTLSAGDNYVIDFTSGVFTISAKHISVRAINTGKTYGDSDPEFTYSADSLVTGDSFTGSLVRDGGANVGEYAINQGTLDAGNNYVIDFSSGVFTISAKHIAVSAINSGKTYGDVDPEMTYNSDVLVKGDSFSGSLARQSGSNKGDYAINQGTLSAGDNYVIDFTPGVFTIAAKHVAVTANNSGKTYGDADPALSYEADALVAGDTYLGNVARVAGSNVGEYEIGQGTLSAGDNYVIDFTAGVFTISKATPVLGALTNEKRQLDTKTFTIPAPTSSVPGSFTYSSSNPAVCTIVGNVATLVSAGTCVITATFTPTDSLNYKSGEKVAMTLSVEASAKTALTIVCHEMPSSQSGEKFHICESEAFVRGTERKVAGTFSYSSSDTSVFTTNGSSAEDWRPRGALTDLSVRTATLTITFTPTDTSTYATTTLTYTVSVSRTSTTGASNWRIAIS